MKSIKFLLFIVLMYFMAVFLITCGGGGDGGGGGGGNVPVNLGIMKDAINYTGTYQNPTSITYTNKSGNVVTVTAFPGKISIVVSPTTQISVVTNLVKNNGGSIIAQIPLLGLYWVSVTPGNEATFISALRANPLIVKIYPTVPSQLSTSQIIGSVGNLDTAPMNNDPTPLTGQGDVVQFDSFSGGAGGTCCQGGSCVVSHGQFVGSILTNDLAGGPDISVSQYQATTPGLTPIIISPGDLAFHLARVAQGAANDNVVKVVNLSLQGIFHYAANGNALGNDDLDRHNCVTADCNQLLSDEEAFLEQLYVTVENMDSSVRNHLVVIVSAGNSGLDLTGEMNFLNSLTPNAAKHILLVGGTESDGTPDAGLNSAQKPSDMIFAQGKDVTSPLGCKSSGTSFAAPQISRLAAQIAKKHPELTGDQIIQAIKDAAPKGTQSVSFLPQGYYTIPTFAQVEKLLGSSTGGVTIPGTWKGTFNVKDASYTYGSLDYTNTTTGSITLALTQSGSNVTGKNTITNLQDSCILHDPTSFCIPEPHCSSAGDIITTVNSSGNLNVTFFVFDCIDYPPFTANITGNTMTGNFSKTSGIGPSTTERTGSFTVTKQ